MSMTTRLRDKSTRQSTRSWLARGGRGLQRKRRPSMILLPSMMTVHAWRGSEISDLRYGKGCILSTPWRAYVLIGYHLRQWLPNFTISKMCTDSSGHQNCTQDVATSKFRSPDGPCAVCSVSVATDVDDTVERQQWRRKDQLYLRSPRRHLAQSIKLERDHISGLGVSTEGFPGGDGGCSRIPRWTVEPTFTPWSSMPCSEGGNG